MEELFSVIVVIIIVVVNIVSKSKKTAKNAPGKKISANQINWFEGVQPAPGPSRPAPAAPAQPIAPAQPAEAAQPVSQEGMSLDEPDVLDESDYARDDLGEGESRECSHGSTGGSMDITDHAGMGEEFVHAEQQVKTSVTTTVKTRVKVNRSDMPAEEEGEAPADAAPGEEFRSMTAEQMRQAVVMAEILKRPSERVRRWPAR